MDVSVPPLEAAFIELFTKQSQFLVALATETLNPFLGIWTLDELMNSVGAIDKSSALKALMTWVDLGVLKEVSEDTFQLLELSEEVSATTEGVVPTRTGWISFFPFCFIVDHIHSPDCRGATRGAVCATATSGADADILEGLFPSVPDWVRVDIVFASLLKGC